MDPNRKQPMSPEWTAPKNVGPRKDDRLPPRGGPVQPAVPPAVQPTGAAVSSPLPAAARSPLPVARPWQPPVARPPQPALVPAPLAPEPPAREAADAFPLGARNSLSGRLPGSSALSGPGPVPPAAMRPAGPAIGLPPGGATNQLIRPATSIPKPPARGGTVYRGLPEIVKIVGWIVLAVAFGFIVGSTAPTAFSRIAAVLQVQPGLLAWYCVRALGILAYLVLAASILYGLLLSTKILDVIAHRPVSFALHKDLAIVALILGTLHGLLLTFDQSFNFTLTAILVPFQSPYAPVAVGIGQLTLYASAVVTASFYVRRRIGQKAWRLLHYITFLVFIGSSVHGITSGSDSGTPWAFWMYLLAVTATIFLTTYRIVVAVAIRADEFDVARITGTGTLPASRGPLDRPGARGGYPWPT